MSVVIADLGVSYGSAEVVRGLTLDVATNEWLALIGPNGAGKTTVLRALAGLVSWTGRVELDGDTASDLPRRTMARRVAFVPQEPVLPPGMTVADYVLLGRTPHLTDLGTESRADLAVAREALDDLSLIEFAGRPLDDLSGGERQRVVLARAFAQEPSILLLDEPTSALDIGHRQHVLEHIRRLVAERPMTVISAMHDLTLAGQFADRLALIADGRIAAAGSPTAVLTESIIAEHYAAQVAVVTLDDASLAVVPIRLPSGDAVH